MLTKPYPRANGILVSLIQGTHCGISIDGRLIKIGRCAFLFKFPEQRMIFGQFKPICAFIAQDICEDIFTANFPSFLGGIKYSDREVQLKRRT